MVTLAIRKGEVAQSEENLECGVRREIFKRVVRVDLMEEVTPHLSEPPFPHLEKKEPSLKSFLSFCTVLTFHKMVQDLWVTLLWSAVRAGSGGCLG